MELPRVPVEAKSQIRRWNEGGSGGVVCGGEFLEIIVEFDSLTVLACMFIRDIIGL